MGTSRTSPRTLRATTVNSDPTVVGSNLVWDLSSVATTSSLNHVVITEVFYTPADLPKESHEWIELYNPTANPIDMTGWKIRDAMPGQTDALPPFTINPGEFVIIAGSTNAFALANPGYAGRAFEVADHALGSGLNTFADGIFLLDSGDAVVDAMSYGGSTAAFNPAATVAGAGQSNQRSPADQDTNSRNDWKVGAPTPGTGAFSSGIAAGATITIVYRLEIACGAAAGQIRSFATYEQPTGTPRTNLTAIFITANPGDLTVTKTPVTQDAGVGDTVVWTVTVKNEGFGNAPNVVIEDNIGSGFEFTSFSVNPTNAGPYGSSVQWDATVIPALTNFAPQQEVSIVVTALMVNCSDLFNTADARWGCRGLETVPDGICEDTALRGETAGASILRIDRYPLLTAALVPPPTIDVGYCTGTVVTLYVTNSATGPDAGTAKNVQYLIFDDDGNFAVSGPSVIGNIVSLGDLAPGASTSVTFSVVPTGATCPVNEGEQPVFLYGLYEDACGNPFVGAPVLTTVRLTDTPWARVSKSMPGTVDPSAASFPVTVTFAYSNLVSASVNIYDVYPKHTNLAVANITDGGVLNTGAGRVEWNPVLDGTGVFTARFDMVFLEPCAGPYGLLRNEIYATNLFSCLGCPVEVEGNGTVYFSDAARDYCYPPGTNGDECSFTSFKTVSPELAEVCEPALLTHRFTSFAGGATPGTWAGVIFTSDLAEGRGYLASTSSVKIEIDGTDVTPFANITAVSPELVIDLSGLDASAFSGPDQIGTNLIVSWEVATTNLGQMVDISSMTIGPCGVEEDYALWDVGQSELVISLEAVKFAEACGYVNGRIDLTQLPSPTFGATTNRIFPSYDVEVVLNLDADNSGTHSYTYVNGSSAFFEFYDLSGNPIPSAEPTLSGNELVWSLGDVRSNGVGYITYQLRVPCEFEPDDLQVAYTRFNTLCNNDTLPQTRVSVSATNRPPLTFKANLDYHIKPEILYLQNNVAVYTFEFVNSGGGTAYNVMPEFFFPVGVSFAGGSVAPAAVSATNAVWDMEIPAAVGSLVDADGDGFFNDLPPGGTFTLVVTSSVDSCLEETVGLRATHGCGGEVCQIPVDRTAMFVPLAGSLVTRTVFPANAELCSTNTVLYQVRNSGLTVDRIVQVEQLLPTGMIYIAGSTRVAFNGVTNAAADPSGSSILLFDENGIPQFLELQPGDELTILYDVYVSCDAVFEDSRFVARGWFTDICGSIITNQETQSVMPVDLPSLDLTKEGRRTSGSQTNFTTGTVVADPGDEIVYRLTVKHSAGSEAPAQAMELSDLLPPGIRYDGASVAPDFVQNVGANIQLVWSNSTLLSLVGGAPWSEASTNEISILVFGTVTNCVLSVPNQAHLAYGCDPSCLSLAESATHTVSSEADVLIDSATELYLAPCGGTLDIVITNRGGTVSGLVVSNAAPEGYIFTSASVSGEFNAGSVTLMLTGTPVGSIALIDLSSTASSGATDVDDDAGDGLTLLDIGYGNWFRVSFNLISSGENLDCLADPTDLDFEDPDPAAISSRSARTTLGYNNMCAAGETVSYMANALPDQPDPDIDLQPNSVIVTNGQVVTFTATVKNNAEVGNAGNLHIRLNFGAGWTNLTFISSNIVSSGTTGMLMEQQGDTNVLIDLPGVILDPVDDFIALTFEATVARGRGPLTARAEVVGACTESGIVPSCVITNTLGEPPMADTMTGSVINAVNRPYYGFDQDQMLALGYDLTKTVRLQGEPAPGGSSRYARIGEDLVYRIHATYFGQTFSNVVVTESLPTNLVFGTPVDAGSSPAVQGWVWDANAGTFTLPSPITDDVDFVVDIPVIVRNILANQGETNNQTIVTNVADSTFTVIGATNVPMPSSTTVPLQEPNLIVTKTSNIGTNTVQAGDIIIFSNVVRHTSLSQTTAYDVVFSDTLPPGLTFSGIDLLVDGIDNDGDGAVDNAEEGLLISGNTFTVSTNHNPALSALLTNQTLTFVFPALVDNQTVGTTITNVGKVTWTSLPGEDPNGEERNGDDGPGGLNDYESNDPEPIRIDSVKAVVKEIVSTTQTNTLGTDLTIGERITYRLRVDVPQGVISNLVITDITPTGMDFVGANPNPGLAFPDYGYSFAFQPGGPAFDTNNVVVTDPDPTPADSLTADGSGAPITFNIGTFTNAADGNLTNDYFELFMEYVLLDAPLNVGLQPTPHTDANRATVADVSGGITVTSPTYRVVEHLPSIQKTRTPAGAVDAGDTITFTIFVSNSVNALANAYDLVARDVLTNSLYDLNTLNVTQLAPGWSATTNALTDALELVFSSDPGVALAPGSRVTNRFTIVTAQSLRPNQRFTNRAELVRSDTIDGNQPVGIEDRDRGSTNSIVLAVTNMTFAKSLFSTSETNAVTDSVGNNVQVGELVTYRLNVLLPEATITNLLVTDNLPLGMSYVIGSATVDTSGFGGTVPPLNVLGPIGAPGDLGPNGSNLVIRFDGNTVVTGNNDASDNSFAIYFDAIVLNTNDINGLPGNQSHLTNTATLTFGGNPSNPIPAGPVVVDVIEPQLQITKVVNPTLVDAGDLVTVTFVVTNVGLATAFDIEVRDFLDPDYFDISTIANFTLPPAFDVSVQTNDVIFTTDPNGVFADGKILAGKASYFSFDIRISSNVTPNAHFTNAVGVIWDSIDGTNTINEQREYGPTNAFATLDAPDISATKLLVGTSETGPVDTTGTNVAIGEMVTYRVVVTLPETTIQNLQVTDLLPVGMEYRGNLSVNDTGFGGLLPGIPSVSGGVGDGAAVTFTFNGSTVVYGDNDINNNSFAIEFDAMVLDVASNDGLSAAIDGDGQTLLTNIATVTYLNNPSNAVPTPPVVVQVVEPSLLIAKTMSQPSNGVVTISLAVTNRGAATAFDVVVTDQVQSVWFDTTTIAPVTVPDGYTYNVAGAPGDATVTFATDPTSGQPTNSIEAGEVVTFQFQVNVLPGLTGTVHNTAVVSEYTTTDGDNPDERNEPPTDSPAQFDNPSFSLVKTLTSPTGGRPADVGEAVVFTITVENTGPIGFSTVELNDTFDPAIIAFSNALPSETSTGVGTIHWADVGPLPVGASTNVVVTFTALASTSPGDSTNAVVAALTTTNGLPLPPQTSEVPFEVLSPSYVLQKQLIDPVGVATVGQSVVFAITLTNDGEVDLNPVGLDDVYDAAVLSFVSATPGVDASAPGSLTWNNVGLLAVGDSTVVTTRFTALVSTWPGDTTNVVVSTASTTNGVPLPPQTSSVPVQVADPGITLIKLAGSAPDGGIHYTNAGAGVIFTYIVTNMGDTYLSPITVTDDVLGVIGTVTNPLAPGDATILYYTSSVPAAVTNIGTVIGTPSYTNGTPIPGLTNVVATNDAIVEMFASLGDFVWLDANYNGIQNGGSETGMPNVTVTLYDAATNTLGTTTTDADGYYYFTNLVPGTYFVGFAPPSGYAITLQNQGGDDTLDSDADETTGYAAPVTLSQGENNLTIDAGVFQLARLGDFVWNDLNADGIQDGGEPGVSNVVVNLYSANDTNTIIATTNTDANGAYEFIDLYPGDYLVEFVLPSGATFSPQYEGGDTAADSNADTASGRSEIVTLVSAEDNPTIDAGIFFPASLGDFVWSDLNANGIQDGGESGLSNIVVNLYDVNDVVIGTTTTDVNGAYIFTNLVPGAYYVGFELPVNGVFSPQNVGNDATDSDADTTTGLTAPVTLTSGEHNPTLDGGIFFPASLGDFVWLDVNHNGLQDGGETGMPDIVVTLYDTSLTPLGVTTTDVSGAYAFTNLLPGTYFVGFERPGGYEFTLRDAGSDDSLDSDPNLVSGLTGPYTLQSGEHNPTVDAGLFQRASLGDYIWLDANYDGIQDTNEVGVANVTVTLYDAASNVVGTTTTDGSGFYQFTNLFPDTYFVGVTLPTGFEFTQQDQGGDDALDSDVNPLTGFMPPVTLVSGENNLTFDAGLFARASLGDYVWHDINWDGIQGGSETGMPNVTVTLYDAISNVVGTTTTDGTGFYEFTNLLPGTYTVGVTPPAGWEFTQQDQGGDDALDSDVDVLSGFMAPVTLVSGEHNPTLDAGLFQRASLGDFVWDDLNADGIQDGGEPGFSNVVVNLLSNGTVIATTTTDVSGAYAFTNLYPGEYVVEFMPPPGTVITQQDQGGDDTLDSDADTTTGRTGTVTLESGENNATLDAGLYIPASLGDYVWLDDNYNGIQDGSEPGISNVVVTLYDAGNAVVGTTTTDGTGFYEFTNLVPGVYTVGFTPLPNFELTLQFQGGSTNLDSNADQGTGISDAVTLISGDHNPTIDAGMFERASLGDYIWHDYDGNGIQDGSETGMPGVVVHLLDASSNVVETTTTDSAGYYNFTNLLPGTYAISIETPAGYSITPPFMGSTTNDSNLSPLTGVSDFVTLGSGEYNPTIDGGLYLPATLGDTVWHDVDGSGLQDGGSETGMPDVVVHLYNTNNVVIMTTTTDVSGVYLFTNLLPGSYYVGFEPPTGYQFTHKDVGLDDEQDSDADQITGLTDVTQIFSGEVDLSWDAGLYLPASLGDYVWLDEDYDSIQSASETGMPDIVVNLYDANDVMVGTTTTDVNGAYAFTNLPPGSYTVEFVKGTNYVFVTPLEGGDTSLDSDADQTTGRADPVVLLSGEHNSTIDAGLAQYGALGDFTWWDINNDGLHNEDLLFYGINDVTVRLFRVSGGVTSLWDTAVTATDTNGQKGWYMFYELPFGDYYVVVDQGNIPNYLPRKTTPMSYSLTISPQYVRLSADFGFNLDPTPITLKSFEATREGDNVRLDWETVSEFENLGYYLYRSTSATGPRTRLNGDLIRGQGTGVGAQYTHLDAGVDRGTTWYYWLEDVSQTFETKLHGPVVVRAEEAQPQDESVANFLVDASQSGLHRITYEALAAAGLNPASLETERIKIALGGREVAIATYASGATLKAGDSVLFYVPQGEGAVEARLLTGDNALRMNWAYAAPADEGALWSGSVRTDGQLPFTVSPEWQRYMLMGFGGSGAIVLDVSDTQNPVMLFGYATLRVQGETGIYLSHDVEEPADCIAVEAEAIHPVQDIERP